MLNREPMWLKWRVTCQADAERLAVSVLNREPMWLKSTRGLQPARPRAVSVLNREPMWLKCTAKYAPPGGA